MWKCPDCETLNKEDFCVVCGKPRPLQTQTSQQSQFAQQAPQQNIQRIEETKVSSKKSPVGLIVALVAVIIAMAAVIIALVGNNGDEPKTEVVVVTQQPQETPEPELTAESTEAPITVTPASVPQYSGPVDENLIQKIRDRYNWVYGISSQCDIHTSNDGATYYYYGGKLVRIDVKPDEMFNYTRCYYYDVDEELCFAFVFIDDRVENRFYFDNGNLIRWKDEFEKIHDYEYNNEQYRQWEEKILEDTLIHER